MAAAAGPGPAVVVAGEALVDLVPDGDGTLREHAGGGPFNTARAIARLGGSVAFLGRLSTDRHGALLRALLAEDGVGLGAVVATDEPTTLALAELDGRGHATYRFYTQGTASAGLRPADALAALPASARVLCVGALGLAVEPVAVAMEALVDRARPGAMIVVDPNSRPGVAADERAYRDRLGRVLPLADVVKASDDDLRWLDPGAAPAATARALVADGVPVVLLTRGPQGATVVTAQGDVDVAAPPVEVRDTIGAGDAFGGAFVAWWTTRGHGREALRDAGLLAEATAFACRVASLTCARPGASPPRLDELGSAPAIP